MKRDQVQEIFHRSTGLYNAGLYLPCRLAAMHCFEWDHKAGSCQPCFDFCNKLRTAYILLQAPSDKLSKITRLSFRWLHSRITGAKMAELAPNITSLCKQVKKQLDTSGVKPETQAFTDVLAWLERMSEDELPAGKKQGYRDFLLQDFKDNLKKHGITSGKICEIGGPNNSFIRGIPGFEFENISLYPTEGDESVLVGDITQCDYIESERYDAIFSVSVFEHIAKPWKAAEQMTRLLKPGGIVYHSAPFSYFYHGAPADYYRYTPDAFEVLFSELETIKAEFYGKNRRRDNRGSASNPVDRDGGAEFSVDGFGGWRENWSSVYCGRKSANYLINKTVLAEKQVILNLLKHLNKSGVEISVAVTRVFDLLKTVRITHDQEIQRVERNTGLNYSLEEIEEIWNTRGRSGLRPSYSRFVMAKSVGF